MKTNLFKSLLVVVMAIGALGGGVNAEETTTSFDFEDNNSVFTIHDKARAAISIVDDTELNSKVMQYTCGNMNSVAFAYYNFSTLTEKASNVKVTFDCIIPDIAGHALISLGDANIHTVANGGFKGKNNSGYGENGSIIAIGCWRANRKNNPSINGKIVSDFLNKWVNVTINVDVVNKKVSYQIKDGETVICEANNIDYFNTKNIASDCSQIDIYTGTVTGEKSIKMDNLKINVTKDNSIEYANYTIKRVCNNNVIGQTQSNGIVGNNPELDNSYKYNFYNEDNSIKYIYVNDDAASKTVAKDGSTVVTVTYREAAKYNYTVNNNINDYSVSGTAFEGDNATVAFSQYILKDGVLYETNKIDDNRKQFNWTFAVNEDNTVKTINYKGTSINNVSYYSEGENIEGLTIINSGNSAVRSSNSASAYAKDADVVFTTLPAGKYKLTSSICDFQGSKASAEFSYKAGEKVIFTHKAEVINSHTKTSEEFTLNESTPISLVKGGNDKQGIDFIYIQRTGDATETVSVSDAGYATYATKYNVEVPNDENVKVMTVKVNDDNSTITLYDVPAGKVIPAGTGILVKAPAGNCDFVVTSTEGTTLEHNSLIAATTNVTSVDDKYFALTKIGDKVGFALVANGVVIPAGKAYLSVPRASGAKFFSLDGEATGINSVKTAKADGAYYTLEGVKTTKPVKGLYIHNGKKIVVK